MLATFLTYKLPYRWSNVSIVHGILAQKKNKENYSSYKLYI